MAIAIRLPKSPYGKYTAHPAADAFPLMEGKDYEEFKDSINRNGQRDPIPIREGTTIMLDGRNRYRACIDIGIEPIFYSEPCIDEQAALDFILDRNVHDHRHLTVDQKAMAFETIEPMYKAAAAERIRQGGSKGGSQKIDDKRQQQPGAKSLQPDITKSDQSSRATRVAKQVANKLGVSEYKVRQAKAFIVAASKDPKSKGLVESVKSGKISLSKASNVVPIPIRHNQRLPDIGVITDKEKKIRARLLWIADIKANWIGTNRGVEPEWRVTAARQMYLTFDILEAFWDSADEAWRQTLRSK